MLYMYYALNCLFFQKQKPGTMIDLFKTPTLRKWTVVIYYLWYATYQIYYLEDSTTKKYREGGFNVPFLKNNSSFANTSNSIQERMGFILSRWLCLLIKLILNEHLAEVACLCMYLFPCSFLHTFTAAMLFNIIYIMWP